MRKPLCIGLIMQGRHSWIGGTEYIRNIILALGSLPRDVRSTVDVCLICSQRIDSNLYNEIRPHISDIYFEEAELPPLTLKNRVYWKFMMSVFWSYSPRWASFIKRAGVNFLYPCNFAYPYQAQCATQAPYRSAAWIYDFQHKCLPHFFSKDEIDERDKAFRVIARHASTIVVSSKSSESDFQKFFPESAHKTKVLSFRTCPSSTWYEANPLQTQRDYFLPDRFFLVSNQFWQHKNHLVVFEALRLLRMRSIYPVVVCTGHIHDYRQADYSDKILQTIHKFGIAQQIYLCGLIPRHDQIQLMRRSLAVIQPSLFEGWSTVVEDARCLGKMVILSDLPVHFEQSPPNSAFFERQSPANLASLLEDCWERLSPGPNLEQEALARTRNLNEVQAFGYCFLEIMGAHP